MEPTLEQKVEKQLEEIKTGLQTTIETSLKDQLAKAVADMQKAMETKNEEAIKKAITENLPLLKEGVDQLKEWKASKDEADKKNQDALDKLIADVKSIMSRRGNDPLKPKTLLSAINEALNEGENFKNLEMLATNHKDRNKRFAIELKTVGDMTTGNVDGSRYGAQFAPGIIENPKRRVHIRTLIPLGAAGPGNTFTYMREDGAGEGSIDATAETSTKPQIDFDLKEVTVNFEVIAGWVRVTRKAMNNIPGFLAFLNSRLPEKLLRAEDDQVISGDGNSPNLKGLTTAGNYTAATSAADILVEQLIDSLAQLEDDEDRNATGILLRPVDYYSFFKNKASGSGEYDLPKNVTFINGILYISGVPVFASTGMASGKYIVGDWEMGSQLLIQEGMRIEFFEQDSTNVRDNKITVRIEESVAFPVYGDNYYIVGDVPNVS